MSVEEDIDVVRRSLGLTPADEAAVREAAPRLARAVEVPERPTDADLAAST